MFKIGQIGMKISGLEDEAPGRWALSLAAAMARSLPFLRVRTTVLFSQTPFTHKPSALRWANTAGSSSQNETKKNC